MTTKPFLDVATLIEAHPRTGAPGRFIDAATIMDELPPERPAQARFPAANRATIQDRLEDEDGLRRRLERDPSDPVAGDQLEALYRRRGDHEQAAALLIDRAEAAEWPDLEVELLVRAAHLYRTELADLDAARMVLVTALSASPSDTRVQDELDAVVCASGDFAAARAAYADAALAVEDPGLAGELWLRVASLHIMERSGGHAVSAALARIEVLDTERAEQLLALCERMAGDLIVLDALAALYRRLDDTAGAARVLALSIEHAGDGQDRARRHHAIAELGDDLEAEWHLAEAVRLAPGRTQSRAALADLYRRRGESLRAARLLEEARLVALNPVDRANLACQAASIYANDLDDGTHAADLYEIAIKSDPERAEAAAPLAERYWQRGCYAELEPLIEVLARRAIAAGNDHDSAEVCYRAGKTALELGKPERALDYLRASIDCAPYHLEALRARAQAAAALGRIDEAYDALTAALEVQERDGACAEELADTVTQLAALAERSGDVDAAIDLYRAALGRVPGHPSALSAALALLRARRDLDGAAEILWHAAESTDGEPRVRALADLAALHARGLDDPERAMDLYREALALAPTDQSVLTALVELYTAAELWGQAVAVLCTLAELEPEGMRSARYFQIAAQLARGRLPDEETAALFARALDAFFAGGAPAERSMCLRAFGDLESLLYGRRAFKALERAYRIMIKRLPVGSPELADLWTRLGALYREELGQPAAAIQSYEVAAELDSDRATRHRVLIDLYEGFAPDQLDKLIERRHRLLRREPTAPEHYRALAILHRRAGRKDHAFLALRALAALGAASRDEQDLLARLDGARPSWPSRPLSPEHHARLRCPEEDPRLTGILGLVTDAIANELAVPPRRLKLRDDLSPSWFPVRDLHAGVAGVIGVSPPPLLVCPELDAEVVFANLKSGGGASRSVAIGVRIAGSSRGEAVHTLARVLSHARPAFFLRLLLSEPGGLDDALDAALMVGGYGGSLAPAPAAHRFAAAIARGLPPSFRDQLAGIVQSIEEPRHELSVERWGQAVDTTCRMTALLLTGDLSTAIAALGREPAHAARRPYADRLAELLVHSCSEEHADLRAAIGLAI